MPTAVINQVLMFDNEDLRPAIKAVSVKKKPWDNCKVWSNGFLDD